MRAARINGEPGFIVYVSGRPLAAMILHLRGEQIHTIYAIGNPEKLQTVPQLHQPGDTEVCGPRRGGTTRASAQPRATGRPTELGLRPGNL